MGHWHDVQSNLAGPARDLRSMIPDTYSGFAALHKGAMGEGVLSQALKEVIALAIAIAEQCDGCIAAHARGAARRGATREQVAEGIGVAILMTGGPGTVYGPRAWEAFLEYSEDQSS